MSDARPGEHILDQVETGFLELALDLRGEVMVELGERIVRGPWNELETLAPPDGQLQVDQGLGRAFEGQAASSARMNRFSEENLRP